MEDGEKGERGKGMGCRFDGWGWLYDKMTDVAFKIWELDWTHFLRRSSWVIFLS